MELTSTTWPRTLLVWRLGLAWGLGPLNLWSFTPAERFCMRNCSFWKSYSWLCLICFEFGHVVVSTNMIGMFWSIDFWSTLHQPRIHRCKRRWFASFADSQFWYLGAMGQKAHVSWNSSIWFLGTFFFRFNSGNILAGAPPKKWFIFESQFTLKACGVEGCCPQ